MNELIEEASSAVPSSASRSPWLYVLAGVALGVGLGSLIPAAGSAFGFEKEASRGRRRETPRPHARRGEAHRRSAHRARKAPERAAAARSA